MKIASLALVVSLVASNAVAATTAAETALEAKSLAAKVLGDDARDLVFIPITPCTVWDTRFATNPDSAGIINNATTKKFYSHLDGAGGSFVAYGGNPSCPETAQNFIGFRPFAVMMTIYTNDATQQGWLTFYRDGDPDPSLATISVYYTAGPTRTQTVISKSSRGYGSGTYDIAVTSRYGNTHAAASVTGYFLKATGAAPTAFGYFYALMPPDNAATVAVGSAVNFPQTAAANGITAVSPTTFNLPAIGVYEVSWQVSITEAGQLVLGLDSGSGTVELPATVAGRSTGTSQIVNKVVITTTAINSIVSVRNPASGIVALSVTPLAGGTEPASAWLAIKQIQ